MMRRSQLPTTIPNDILIQFTVPMLAKFDKAVDTGKVVLKTGPMLITARKEIHDLNMPFSYTLDGTLRPHIRIIKNTNSWTFIILEKIEVHDIEINFDTGYAYLDVKYPGTMDEMLITIMMFL